MKSQGEHVREANQCPVLLEKNLNVQSRPEIIFWATGTFHSRDIDSDVCCSCKVHGIFHVSSHEL